MQKLVVPKEGLMVRDPVSFNPLPKDGLLVDWNGNAGRFWRRRVRCGDVTIQEVVEEIEETTEPLQKRTRRK